MKATRVSSPLLLGTGLSHHLPSLPRSNRRLRKESAQVACLLNCPRPFPAASLTDSALLSTELVTRIFGAAR